MSYTAAIVDKRIEHGQLHVTLEYSDGETTFREEMVSRSGQVADWITSEVARRINDLASVEVLHDRIALGPVELNKQAEAQRPATPRDEYAERLRIFEGWLNALRQGVTTIERPAFVALKQWLRDNWRDEYLELYLR